MDPDSIIQVPSIIAGDATWARFGEWTGRAGLRVLRDSNGTCHAKAADGKYRLLKPGEWLRDDGYTVSVHPSAGHAREVRS